MVAGHLSPSSRRCSRCATHLAVMPFELLTLVLVHLPLLPFQSLWTWRGDDFCTVISFVITDTLYLVWLASRSEVPWWGHRCALPISWSHKWELCICGRPVFLSTSISEMCGQTGLKRSYSSQYTPYTIHVSINVNTHVNFVRPSIRSHSVSFVWFFLLTPGHVTPLKDDSTWAHLHSIVVINQACGIIWDSVENIITPFLQENWLLYN